MTILSPVESLGQLPVLMGGMLVSRKKQLSRSMPVSPIASICPEPCTAKLLQSIHDIFQVTQVTSVWLRTGASIRCGAVQYIVYTNVDVDCGLTLMPAAHRGCLA